MYIEPLPVALKETAAKAWNRVCQIRLGQKQCKAAEECLMGMMGQRYGTIYQ